MKLFIRIFPMAFLVGISLLFFYQTILYGKLPVPSDALVGLYHPWRDFYASEYPRGVPFKNFLITDPVRQQIPWRKIVMDQWKQGIIPRWNPYSFSGTPLAANIQSAVFYPLNVLFFLFDFSTAWAMLIMLQPLFAGIFFYKYARSKNFSPVSSTAGSVTWSFSGFMVSWMTWGTMGHVALWLPLILLGIDKRNFWILTTALVMQFFAGHIQVSVYIMTLAVIYAIYTKAVCRSLLMACIVALTITSIQWIPLVQLFLESGRGVEIGVSKPGWLMPWYHMVQFFAPDFFGNPSTLNYWGEWNYGEFVGFIGVIPLLFVVLSLTSNQKETLFWKLTCGISLLLMISHPLTNFFYSLPIPILSTMQPTRLMVIVDFSLAMLALYGMEAWRKAKKERWSTILTLGCIYGILWFVVLVGKEAHYLVSRSNLILPTAMMLAGVVLYIIPFKKAALLGIVVLLSFDLLRFGWKFTPFTPVAYFFPKTEVISYLQSLPKPFRVMAIDDRLLPPNVSAYYGIEMINGYDPLIYRPYEQLLASSERGEPNYEGPTGFNRIIVAKNYQSPLVPQLNVAYILSLDELTSPLLTKVKEEGQTKLYRYIQGLPRVHFEPFDETDVQPTITEYEDNRLIFAYESVQARTIRMSMVAFRGWRAWIDGQPVVFEKPRGGQEGIFLRIQAPAGEHTVRLQYY